jgi:hypothetical protein
MPICVKLVRRGSAVDVDGALYFRSRVATLFIKSRKIRRDEYPRIPPPSTPS